MNRRARQKDKLHFVLEILWIFLPIQIFTFFILFKQIKCVFIQFSSVQNIWVAITLFMHQGSASEHGLSHSHNPSPCILALPHPAPVPPPPRPTLPSGSFHTMTHKHKRTCTYTHTHSQEFFFSPHFLSQRKTGWRGSFKTRGYRGNPLILLLSNLLTL